MASPLSRQLNSIFYTKENLAKEGDLFFKDYEPYIINRFLAKHRDTLYHATVLNGYSNISKEDHYDYLLFAVRPAKRFAKLAKTEIDDNIELIKKHYKYNDVRAREVLKILSVGDINQIRELYKHDEPEPIS